MHCSFGITCITVDGNKHSRGSLEGGWRPQDRDQGSICACKLSLQGAQTEASIALERLACLSRAQAHQDAARDRLHDLEHQLEQLQGEVEETELKLRQAGGQLKSAQDAHDAVRSRMQHLQQLKPESSDPQGRVEVDLQELQQKSAQRQAELDQTESRLATLFHDLQVLLSTTLQHNRALRHHSPPCNVIRRRESIDECANAQYHFPYTA
jgi:chromosome segregation ATPase